MPCAFSLDPSRKLIENEHAIAFACGYPVTEGHTLVVPRQDVASIYELSTDQQAAVW
jgi:diadenosine tetraphosphate (Ap4A) HIT family hydrolase